MPEFPFFRAAAAFPYTGLTTYRTVTIDTPQATHTVPLNGNPSAYAAGAYADVVWPFWTTPNRYLSVTANAGIGYASGNGYSTTPAAATLGAQFNIPNSHTHASIDAGLALWAIDPSDDSNVKSATKRGGQVALAVSTQAWGPLDIFTRVALRSDGTDPEVMGLIGAAFYIKRPTPPIGIDDGLDAIDARIALKRAVRLSETMLQLSVEAPPRVRKEIEAHANNVAKQLSLLAKYVDWFSNETVPQEFLGLPPLRTTLYTEYAKKILPADDTESEADRTSYRVNSQLAIARLVQSAADLLITGDTAIAKALLLEASTLKAAGTKEAVDRYEKALDATAAILKDILGSDDMKGRLPQVTVEKLGELDAQVACLKTGEKCNEIKDIDLEWTVPSLKKALNGNGKK